MRGWSWLRAALVVAVGLSMCACTGQRPSVDPASDGGTVQDTADLDAPDLGRVPRDVESEDLGGEGPDGGASVDADREGPADVADPPGDTMDAPAPDAQDVESADVSDGDAADVEDAPDAPDGDVADVEDAPDVSPAGPCPMPAPEDYFYQVGVSELGQNGYVEYVPGDLPIIIAAPHGGLLEPEGLPADPDALSRDAGSLETALLVFALIRERTGRTPHLVINHIRRNRVNMNREDARPNADHPAAMRAFSEFHGFIEDAKRWTTAACGAGHFFDFHTNGHAERWVEVGIGLRAVDLALSDDDLDSPASRERSFYRSLANQPGVDFVEIIRGPTSLGGLLEAAEVRVVPSPMNPDPHGGGYFTGGYNSQVHGSRYGGTIDASQLEFHFSYVNAGAEVRDAFSATLTGAMMSFVETHYGYDLDAR